MRRSNKNHVFLIVLLLIAAFVIKWKGIDLFKSTFNSLSVSEAISNVSDAINNGNTIAPLDTEPTIDMSTVKNRFYYKSLKTGTDRKAYAQIYECLVNCNVNRVVNVDEVDRLGFIFECVLNDNPELFYANSDYQYYQNNDDSMTLVPSYSFDAKQRKAATKKLKSYTSKFMKNISDDMSDYEKEIVIYQYINKHTTYQLGSDHNQNIYSVVLGKSVCAGYGKMFQYLCYNVGINCTVIRGNMDGEPHLWNCVRIGGDWYMTDATSIGIEIDGKTDYGFFNRFNLTKKKMLRSLEIDNIIPPPKCNSIKADYYYRNGLYFKEPDYNKLASIFYNDNDNCVRIECENMEVMKEMKDYLYTNRGIEDMISCSSYRYMELTNDMYIIQISWE